MELKLLSIGDVINSFKVIKCEIEEVIKKQLTLGFFIDWEEWFNEYFNPLNKKYEELYKEIAESGITKKPVYEDFRTRMISIMTMDCDMKLYD